MKSIGEPLKGRMGVGVALGVMLACTLGGAEAATPNPWQLGFPEPASPIAREVRSFHDNLLMPVITVISLFVLGLLVYVGVRFSEKRNPTPSRRTHNTPLEIIWTVIPVLILVTIFIPSIRLHYYIEEIPESDLTLKIIGNQWYWSYEYPDENIAFDSTMLEEDELAADQKHLYKMLTDTVVVLPVNKTIRLQFTSNDVLHNWAISDIAVRMDTVPGRLNEAWTRIDREGTYYGFCSELCGLNHAYMPITVKAVSWDKYQRWLVQARAEFAKVESPDALAVSSPSRTEPSTDMVRR